MFVRLQVSPEQVSPARLLSPGLLCRRVCPLLLILGASLIIPRERHRGVWQPSVSRDGCLVFFLQAMQSLRKSISASSWCRLPAKVKQSLDGAEQLLCHRLSQFIKTPVAFFGNFFSLFSLSPSFLVLGGRLEEQSVTLSEESAVPGGAATSGHKPSLERQCWGNISLPAFSVSK